MDETTRIPGRHGQWRRRLAFAAGLLCALATAVGVAAPLWPFAASKFTAGQKLKAEDLNSQFQQVGDNLNDLDSRVKALGSKSDYVDVKSDQTVGGVKKFTAQIQANGAGPGAALTNGGPPQAANLIVDQTETGNLGLLIKGKTVAQNYPDLALSLQNSGLKDIVGASIAGVITAAQAGAEAMDLVITTKPGNGTVQERMRIASNGNVGIGVSSPANMLHLGKGGAIQIDDGSATRNGSLFHSDRGNFHLDANGGGAIYLAWYGGSAVHVGNGKMGYGSVLAASFAQMSSARFKRDIREARYGVADVVKLAPKSFLYRADVDGKRHIGFVAEEVDRVIPEVVEHEPDGTPRAIDYSKLSVVLVGAVREQQTAIAALRRDNDELRARLDRLAARDVPRTRSGRPDPEAGRRRLETPPSP